MAYYPPPPMIPMASYYSTHHQYCGVCYEVLSGEAFITGRCSHTFHTRCHNTPFSNCPICLPSTMSDDEPLPAPAPASSPSSHKVTVKSIPELPAVASSDSASPFTVLVGLKAPPSLSEESRAPIDLVTVLDVSGSMAGHKLSLLKQAVWFVIQNLGPSDRLSIVSFHNRAQRVLPLRRMTSSGQVEAEKAVNSLYSTGGTNIVQGLEMGVRILEGRRQKNPVTSIIFLSDGNDTCNHMPFPSSNTYNLRSRAPNYLHMLPAAIFPKNKGEQQEDLQTIPVHSFGFGSDHDSVVMHAIAEASGGTFSFIESYPMVQDAFASCIGGLLSVVAQEVRLTVRTASHGVDILSISSGRYRNEISEQGSKGVINVDDLYADEEKDFLVNLVVPRQEADNDNNKTSLLDISCWYREVVSNEEVRIEGDNLVEIKRPETVSAVDKVVNLEVDRQRNLVYAAEGIGEAQKMAEMGNLADARSLLAERRDYVRGSVAGQAGDGLCAWLEKDMKETEKRFESKEMYYGAGQAFALSGMSSYGMQRATTRGNDVPGAAASSPPIGGDSGAASNSDGGSFSFGYPPSSAFGYSSLFGSGCSGYSPSPMFGSISAMGSGSYAAAPSPRFGSISALASGSYAPSSLFGSTGPSSAFGASSSSMFGCDDAAAAASSADEANSMDFCFSDGGDGGGAHGASGFGGAFVTPSMVSMVNKSQNHNPAAGNNSDAA